MFITANELPAKDAESPALRIPITLAQRGRSYSHDFIRARHDRIHLSIERIPDVMVKRLSVKRYGEMSAKGFTRRYGFGVSDVRQTARLILAFLFVTDVGNKHVDRQSGIASNQLHNTRRDHEVAQGATRTSCDGAIEGSIDRQVGTRACFIVVAIVFLLSRPDALRTPAAMSGIRPFR